MSTIIPTGFDNVTILRGSKYKGIWEWDNCDFAGLTGTVKIKNIHSQFSDVKNTYEVGTVTVEPLDADGNHQKGRILVELSKEDTILFAIPDDEEFSYDEQSGYYSVMNVTLSDGTVILSANVKVINSLESETLNYLLDEKDEAIIINQKLDEILARKNEYISIRDNLIDVVIPNSLETYNLNHNEKMSIYNTNYNDKLSVYNSNDAIKINNYNQNHTTKFQEVNQVALTVQADKELIEQAKLNILAMKDNIEGNTNSVILMKNAIEAMLDNFDDRFLGQKDSDPLLDNDGNPLVIGTIYYNNPAKELRFYNGVSWDSPVASAQTYALQASQYASNALASKNASKISEDNAKLSEQNAQALANQVANNYEPKNANIQSHISNSSNPHGTTASQVGAYSISESDAKFSSKINITDIIDNLNSTLTNKPLSANQGKILKGYIDSINTLLSSDDTSLDTLQEIVAYIKANKNNLDALADIHSKTAKTTPVDADEMMIADSTTTFSLKKITWSSIKTTIKTYLDTYFISKITTPTTNALAKIQADGTIKNSSIIEDANGNVGVGGVTPYSQYPGVKSIDLGSYTSITQGQGGEGSFESNSYKTGATTWNYKGSGVGASRFVNNFGSFQWQTAPIGTAGNVITWTTAMALDTGQLTLTSVVNGIKVNANTTTGINFWSSNYQAPSTGWYHYYGTSSNNTHADIAIYGNGNIVNANNSYGAISDIKLKENIVDASPKLDKLMQVRVVNYNLIGDDKKQIGVIAQEIEKVFPGVVEETKDTKQVEVEKERIISAVEEKTEERLVVPAVLGDDGTILEDAIYETVIVQEYIPERTEKYTDIETIETGETTKNVKYSVIYMMMLKAMQEQNEIINKLKSRIEVLENK